MEVDKRTCHLINYTFCLLNKEKALGLVTHHGYCCQVTTLRIKQSIKSRFLMFSLPTTSMKRSTVGRDLLLITSVWGEMSGSCNINFQLLYLNIKVIEKINWNIFSPPPPPTETSAFRDCRRRISVRSGLVYISGRFTDLVWKCLPQNGLPPHGLMLCN